MKILTPLLWILIAMLVFLGFKPKTMKEALYELKNRID